MNSEVTQPRTGAILLIGGNGYIGQALIPFIRERSQRVTVLSRTLPSPEHQLKGVHYVMGDFGDRSTLDPLLDDHGIVVHLAYATVPNTSFDNPLADLTKNLVPAVGLFDGVAARNSLLILVSSGGTVYGEARQLPIPEDHPLHPISPYGVTKLTLENYAYLYSVTKGLRYLCVRPANPYGPGQRPFSGQGFIATAFGCAMQGRPIGIFGDRDTVRDYVFIRDLGEGLAELITKGSLSHTYNLGSGIGHSNLDVVHTIGRLVTTYGLRLDVQRLPARPFDVSVNVLDITKTKRATGWQPKITFDEGLHLTYEWIRVHIG